MRRVFVNGVEVVSQGVRALDSSVGTEQAALHIEGVPSLSKEESVIDGAKDIVLTVNGDVKGSLKIEPRGSFNASLKVVVLGSVTGSVTTTWGDIRVEGDVQRGSAESMSGNVEVGGDVSQNATSMSGNIVVHGNVSRQPSSVCGSVKIESKKPSKKRGRSGGDDAALTPAKRRA